MRIRYRNADIQIDNETWQAGQLRIVPCHVCSLLSIARLHMLFARVKILMIKARYMRTDAFTIRPGILKCLYGCSLYKH
jgi:hypothetical protein